MASAGMIVGMERVKKTRARIARHVRKIALVLRINTVRVVSVEIGAGIVFAMHRGARIVRRVRKIVLVRAVAHAKTISAFRFAAMGRAKPIRARIARHVRRIAVVKAARPVSMRSVSVCQAVRTKNAEATDAAGHAGRVQGRRTFATTGSASVTIPVNPIRRLVWAQMITRFASKMQTDVISSNG
jgi:hypothetical protein